MLIAVATQSGSQVDQAFGQASQYILYDYANRQVVKTVDVVPFGVCPSCSGNPEHTFDAERFNAITQAIDGCKAVVVKKIGAGPRQHLIEAGFTVVESDADIDSALKQAHDQACPNCQKSSGHGCPHGS